MAPAKKPKAAKLPPPVNEAQVAEYISVIGEAEVVLTQAGAKATKAVQQIEQDLAHVQEQQGAIIKRYATALFSYFEKHRDQLTDNGKRASCTFATGVLGERRTPPRTKLEDEPAVLEYLVKHELEQFFETKRAIRRDALLAQRDEAAKIPGVSFVQDRIVYVKPDQFDVEVELKKRIEPA